MSCLGVRQGGIPRRQARKPIICEDTGPVKKKNTMITTTRPDIAENPETIRQAIRIDRTAVVEHFEDA